MNHLEDLVNNNNLNVHSSKKKKKKKKKIDCRNILILSLPVDCRSSSTGTRLTQICKQGIYWPKKEGHKFDFIGCQQS